MTEEVDSVETTDQNTPPIDELQAQLADSLSQNDAMRNKMNELLGETKKAKRQKAEAEEAARLEIEQKAKKQGDYEQLFNSSQEKVESLTSELTGLRDSIAKEKENSTALIVASELADGANAEILSDYIARRLKYTDEGIKILDSNGGLTVSTIEQLKQEFSTNERFKSLLRGSQANGGGATGGSGSSGSTEKLITRDDFDKLDPAKRMKFVKDGGNIIN